MPLTQADLYLESAPLDDQLVHSQDCKAEDDGDNGRSNVTYAELHSEPVAKTDPNADAPIITQELLEQIPEEEASDTDAGKGVFDQPHKKKISFYCPPSAIKDQPSPDNSGALTSDGMVQPRIFGPNETESEQQSTPAKATPPLVIKPGVQMDQEE